MELLSMKKLYVSEAEILDKLTILEIKSKNINDHNKIKNIKIELDILKKESTDILLDKKIFNLYLELKKVNTKLWEIEDNIRIKERNKSFDNDFIELARSVYRTNDQRASIKKQINTILNSEIIEEKSYEPY
jgi:hypothetical protein